MKPCADCEPRPAEVPADSVRNAAAFWVSAGKVAGFAEGVRAAAKALEEALDVDSSTNLGAFLTFLREMAAAREKQAEPLNRAATLMVERLEAASRRRGVRRRLRDAYRALLE